MDDDADGDGHVACVCLCCMRFGASNFTYSVSIHVDCLVYGGQSIRTQCDKHHSRPFGRHICVRVAHSQSCSMRLYKYIYTSHTNTHTHTVEQGHAKPNDRKTL